MSLRSCVGRLDEGSNATSLPQSQHPRLLLYQKRPNLKGQASTISRGKMSANKCKSCGRKYQTRRGLIYHRENHPNCDSTTPRSYKSKKRKLNSYSNPGYTQPRADRQRPIVSFPNLIPRETPTTLPQVDESDKAPALEHVSLGPTAEEAERGRQKAGKDKSQIQAEQSARALRVWAIRRALGTNGRNGGPPKPSTIAKKAKLTVPTTAPNPETYLTPSVADQSGHSHNLLSNQTEPIVFENEVRRDVNSNKQSVTQIISAAPETENGSERIKPPRKVSMYQNVHEVSLTRHSTVKSAIRVGSVG